MHDTEPWKEKPFEITAFYSDQSEREVMMSLAEAAQRAGFTYKLSKDLNEKAEIGIYGGHQCGTLARNSKLSIIMLHDLAQGHNVWPDIWHHDQWHFFDIGFLPNQDWVERWQLVQDNSKANPKIGMYLGGWPKSDQVVVQLGENSNNIKKLRKSLKLKYDVSVLYAPSWEFADKQGDFIRSLVDLPVNLLIKQIYFSADYPEVNERVKQALEKYQNYAPNVHILDPNESIMHCLALADVMVSDESSVLVEALLFGVPGIAVEDWKIPDIYPPRNAIFPLDFVTRTTKSKLRETVVDLLDRRHSLTEGLLLQRERFFGKLGCSADTIMSTIKSIALTGTAPDNLITTTRLYFPDNASTYGYNKTRNVWVRPEQEKFAYSDGDAIESKLLAAITTTKDRSVMSDELQKKIEDWPSMYHFSSSRANLLRPHEEILKNAFVLELGGGCGGITRYLGETCASVTMIEGSIRRATIAAARCNDLENIQIYCDNIMQADLPFGTYDVVTLIGVLEYARLFDDENQDPVQAMLERAKKFLKPGGKMILAIENQLGLKYFAGAPEDHFGIPMYGINDLYSEKSAVTFGAKELRDRLKKAGFHSLKQFIPFPDYKIPAVILHPNAQDVPLDKFDIPSLIRGQTARAYLYGASQNFSLETSWDVVARNGLIWELCNSFCFVAAEEEQTTKSAQKQALRPLAWHYSVGRPTKFMKEALFVQKNNTEIVVKRTPMAPAAQQHNGNLSSVYPEEEAYLPYPSYITGLVRIVNRPEWTIQQVTNWFKPLLDNLKKHAVMHNSNTLMIPSEFADANAYNTLIDSDGKLHYIDLEWNSKELLPFFYAPLYSLTIALMSCYEVAPPKMGTPDRTIDLSLAVLSHLGIEVTPKELDNYWLWLRNFFGEALDSQGIDKSHKNSCLTYRYTPDQLKNHISELQNNEEPQLSALQEEIKKLQKERDLFKKMLDRRWKTQAS